MVSEQSAPIGRPGDGQLRRQGLSPRLAGLALILASGCVPALASAETLADAVTLAYQTNPAIQAQRAQLRALNETYVQARAGFGLHVSADGNLAYEELQGHNGRSGSIDLQGSSSTETLNLSQPLFTGGRTTTALQAAEADVRAGRERLRQQEADLLQRVISAYVAVRRDAQVLIVARSTVNALQEQLQETQAKTDVRENTRTDLAQAQARLAAAMAQVASAENQLSSSRAQYLNAVGQNPGDLAPEPDLPGVPANIDQAFDQAEAHNPTLLAAKFAELASRARVANAKTQNMPSVTLRVAAGRAPSAYYQPNPYLDSLTAQAVYSQPLFTAGVNGSQIRRATELNTADRLTIDATRRNVVQGVSQQWSTLAAARLSLAADQANVAASETAFFGMRQEERLGLRSTIELLNAQQELTSAQLGLYRDRYSEYVARAGVLNQMGVLSVETLAPGVSSYDPLADFDRVKNKGALPTDEVVRILDGLVTRAPGPPRAASETATPDRQVDLPAAPLSAAAQPPLRSVTELMEETRETGPR
jgi:outer membrane protein/S-layer protein transport system outer membrane protein